MASGSLTTPFIVLFFSTVVCSFICFVCSLFYSFPLLLIGSLWGLRKTLSSRSQETGKRCNLRWKEAGLLFGTLWLAVFSKTFTIHLRKTIRHQWTDGSIINTPINGDLLQVQHTSVCKPKVDQLHPLERVDSNKRKSQDTLFTIKETQSHVIIASMIV